MMIKWSLLLPRDVWLRGCFDHVSRLPFGFFFVLGCFPHVNTALGYGWGISCSPVEVVGFRFTDSELRTKINPNLNPNPSKKTNPYSKPTCGLKKNLTPKQKP